MSQLTISSDVLGRVLRDLARIKAMRPDKTGANCGEDCDYTGQCECCKGVDAACDAGDEAYHRQAEGD